MDKVAGTQIVSIPLNKAKKLTECCKALLSPSFSGTVRSVGAVGVSFEREEDEVVFDSRTRYAGLEGIQRRTAPVGRRLFECSPCISIDLRMEQPRWLEI